VFPANPGHLRAFDYLGLYRYFLTFCLDRRRTIFMESLVVELVLRQIRRAAVDEAFAVAAYCFMPDHLHLLVEGLTDASDCRRFIKCAKQLSGYYYSRASGGAKLWQRYGYERALRSDEATLIVAKYILENPVRAGLVRRPEDYRFLGSDMYSITEILEAAGEYERST
jgi:putative transposase